MRTANGRSPGALPASSGRMAAFPSPMSIRKLLAAFASAALATAALAQQTEKQPAEPPSPGQPPQATEAFKLPFTIYGTLNVNLQWTKAEGATNPAQSVKSRTAVSTDSSNIGIRGTFDVLGGLKVVYQCETSAALNGVSPAGICGRNSRIGLSSPAYGTLFYGNWDTPYKATIFTTKADDPFYATDVWDFESIMTLPGFNTKTSGWVTGSNTPVASFAIRLNNTVAYHSPTWSGLSFKLAYGADYFKNASGTQDPTLYSAAVNYDRGPLSVGAAYENHHDGFGLVAINPAVGGTGATAANSANSTFGATIGNTVGTATVARHSTDQAWHVAAGYELGWTAGTTTVAAMIEQLNYEQSDAPDGAVKKYDRFAWQVSARHRIGNNELKARFSQAAKGNASLAGGAAADTSGYGAWDLAVGYAYWVAKTGQVYLNYTIIQNQRRAQYTFGTAGSPAVAGATPAGADPMALGLGIRYGF